MNIEGIAEAFDDIRYYHDRGPEFLALNQGIRQINPIFTTAPIRAIKVANF